MDLTLDEFAADVGADGPVTISGHGTRGGPVRDVRSVRAPAGIDWIEAAEMTVQCGAATPMDELDEALAGHGQRVALPPSGTVGGALAAGRSGLRRLGDGPLRDTVLQLRYVSAAGKVVKAGGPTVKNVSGFDLCRLLVGSHGTLGFFGDVILRTRPRARNSLWFTSGRDPWDLLVELYRPVSMLWDGTTTWVLLEGEAGDIGAQQHRHDLTEVAGPPVLPTGARWSMPPEELRALRIAAPGRFVAEVGVGIVHHTHPAPARTVDGPTRALHSRIKAEFDPTGRLNPGRSVLDVG